MYGMDMAGLNFRNALFSLFLALQPNLGCVWREPKPMLCSYDAIEETEKERITRLGDTGCDEIIPGHNNIFEDRINIVFSGLNTGDDTFTENIRNSVDCSAENNGLLSNEVISDNISRFNFWYNPSISRLPYADGIFYKDETLEEIIDPKLQGAIKARECDLQGTSWRNVVSVTITDNLVRSRANYPRLFDYNIDRNNFEDLLQAKETLINYGLDQNSCENFISACNLLDHNNDGIYEESDLEINYPYSPEELDRICYALQIEECDAPSRQEIISRFEDAGKEYGLQLCQTFSNASYTSENAATSLCKAIVGEDDYDLGSAIVYNGESGMVPSSVIHETGHSIWALRDEYTSDSDTEDHGGELVITSSIQRNGINCFAGTYQECLKNSNWSHLEGTGCYEGCNYLRTGAFRPMENTYMNNNFSADGYGPYSEERICKMLTLLTEGADGICRDYLNGGE